MGLGFESQPDHIINHQLTDIQRLVIFYTLFLATFWLHKISDIPLCKSDVCAARKRSAKPSSEAECSHQSCVLSGLVERSAVWLAERSLRREDGRTADTAGMGGWDLKVRTAAVESTVG